MGSSVSCSSGVALIRTTSSRRSSSSSRWSRRWTTSDGLADSTARARAESPRDTRRNPKAKVDVFDNDLLKLRDAGGVRPNRQRTTRRRCCCCCWSAASPVNVVVIDRLSANRTTHKAIYRMTQPTVKRHVYSHTTRNILYYVYSFSWHRRKIVK